VPSNCVPPFSTIISGLVFPLLSSDLVDLLGALIRAKKDRTGSVEMKPILKKNGMAYANELRPI
jgi:hypothetical protein